MKKSNLFFFVRSKFFYTSLKTFLYNLSYLMYLTDIPGEVSGKESACQYRRHRDVASIPGLGRSPAVGNGTPLQCSCLENTMGREVW